MASNNPEVLTAPAYSLQLQAPPGVELNVNLTWKDTSSLQKVVSGVIKSVSLPGLISIFKVSASGQFPIVV